MNAIRPWLDAEEVRLLAERLLAPMPQSQTLAPDAGFDPDFIGYAAARPHAPEALPPPAPIPPKPPMPERAISLPESSVPFPFQPQTPDARHTARGPFLDRIVRFRDWLSSEFSATGIFILDREGFAIFDESGNDKLHSLARNLALAARKPGTPPSNVRLKIGSRATLEVIPVDTAYGYLVLAAIVPDVLQPAAITTIMDALSKAAAPPQ